MVASAPMRLLALDAGNCSGWALWDSEKGLSLEKVGCQGVKVDPIERRIPVYKRLLEERYVDAYAYEQFVVRQPIREAHSDVLYINGAVECAAASRNKPVHRYTPAVSKRRVSDNDLKNLGWWPGFGLRTGGHAADAARILVCMMQDHYPDEYKKVVADS